MESLNHALAFAICSGVLVDSSDSISSKINRSGRVDPCLSPRTCVPSPFASTLILLDVINSYLLSSSLRLACTWSNSPKSRLSFSRSEERRVGKDCQFGTRPQVDVQQ